MPTTANTINYYIAEDGTLRDGAQGAIAQTPRVYYGTEYAVTLSFPPSTIAEGDQLQVALNRTRTFFSSASATGDAPVAAVSKHDVTAEEAAAQEVALTLSTNTRAMIDQVNGIDHPVRGFFGVHVLRGQSFVTLAVADALMMSLESGPDAISPSLPVVDYPTRQEAEALADRSEAAAERAEQAAAGIVPPLQLSAPPTTSTVGSVGQLATWHDVNAADQEHADHLYHLVYITTSENATLYHWEECVLVSQGNVAGGYPVLDANGKVAAAQLPINTFKLGGTKALSATEIAPVNGEIIIPLCSSNGFAHRGLLFVDGYYGFSVASNCAIQLTGVTNDNINDRLARRYFALNQLDYAVRSVLPNVTEIPAATSDYSLVDSSATMNNHSHVYSHAPSAAPTYRLPQVTNTTIAHYIELTVDFTNVQTYSFLDANGDALVPLFTPSIAAGDVYTFKMEYSAIKAAWLIYPQKQGAVADDFVMRGEVGAANGVAGLDGNALINRNILPVATGFNTGSAWYGVVKGPQYFWGGSHSIGIVNGEPHVASYSPDQTMVASKRNKPIASQPQTATAAVTINYIDEIVKLCLSDGIGTAYTDEEKCAAQQRLGVGGPITAIPAATSQYTLSYGRFSHVPELASTYVLPAVADGSITNDITLAIKFSADVLTYEFQDSDGNTLVPLPLNGDIEDGSVVTFLCRYNPLLSQWVIYPVMDGKEAQE